VTVFEEDKLKLHIHTPTPEKVLTFCHGYGEFLTMKIENMSVQHQELYTEEPATPYGEGNGFSVVAVAHNSAMKQAFLEMGADHVILADYQNPPTASDFLEAFALSVPDTVLVFPNNKNTELSAVQAQRLCEDKKILVAATRSDAQCYAALPMIDYNCEEPAQLPGQVEQIVSNLDIIMVSQVEKSTVFDGQPIEEGDYVSILGHELIAVNSTLEQVCIATVSKVLSEKDCEVITLFTGKAASDQTAETICSFVAEHYLYTEITVVPTDDDFYQVVLSFE
jgi:dihydroxyacetone kinase-like predicted kinase